MTTSVFTRRSLLTGGFLVLGASYGTRKYYDNLQKKIQNSSVHPDQTRVDLGIQPQVQRQVQVVFHEGEQGKLKSAILSHSTFSELLMNQVHELHDLRLELKKTASEELDKAASPIFNQAAGRSERFAGWYFGYSTTFKLLGKASSAAARHTVDFGSSQSLSEAVGAELEKYLLQKYERIVLQPELTDPQLNKAYVNVVQSTHTAFVKGIVQMQRKVAQSLAEKTTHLEPITAQQVNVRLDWDSQVFKIRTISAHYEKTPEITLALSAGGALLGKAVGAAGGKVAASAFLSKIAAPFVTKVVAPGVGMAAGSVVGPLGGIIGAGVGLGIDFTFNKGLELMHRDAFLSDVHRVLLLTQADFNHRMGAELNRVIDVWVDDAVQVLLESSKQ
eukprot:c5885_g1_i1.p1 GENE.c5885_g1_i1~~c5885_g1_i1.p1  ORF type:complete len:389 (+),score=76.54 c5885_g1_i1:35-1201(+)